jgi:flagellar biosynthesis anti-sigma factor FlgM
MDVRDVSSLIPPIGNLNTEAAGGVRRATPSSAENANVAPAVDRSDLSSIARTLASAAGQPDVRLDRVAALQQQIASGAYAIKSQDVAEALLRNLGS